MNKTTSIVIVIIVIALGVWLVMSHKTVNAPADNVGINPNVTNPNDTSTNTTPATPDATSNTTGVNAGLSVGTGKVDNFTVTGMNYSFTPTTLTAKKGDTVNITFKNQNGFHDLHIDEFNVATAKIQGGSEQTITFVADKTGSFQYYCSVGNHRAMGMWGTLTVTE